jgi:hypothetical protein
MVTYHFDVGNRICLALAHNQKGEVLKVKDDKVLVLWDDDYSDEWVDGNTIELL